MLPRRDLQAFGLYQVIARCRRSRTTASRALLNLFAALLVLAGVVSPEVSSADALGTPSPVVLPAAATPECPEIGSTFSSPLVSGTLTAPEDIDCLTVGGVASGDSISIGVTGTSGQSYVNVLDGSGNGICAGWWGRGVECRLSGVGPWRIHMANFGGAPTMPYGIWVRRLTAPQGCTALPAAPAFAFDAAPAAGSVTATLPDRCFTFTRGEDDGDAAMWLRAMRTSGAASFQWSVVGPAGTTDCQGSDLSWNRCALLATGQFTVVVLDTAVQGGSFALRTIRTDAPTGCGSPLSTSFGTPPSAMSVATGEADCRAISDVQSGDQINVTSAGNLSWLILDGDGHQICASSWMTSQQCAISGSPGWQLVTYDPGGGTASAVVAVRRVSDPEGCTEIDPSAQFSFASTRINGSVTGVATARCYTFERGSDEPDASVWLRAVRTSGTLNPRWRIFGPSGGEECSGNAQYSACRLLGYGRHTIVVDDDNAFDTGSFFLTTKRLSHPAGCTDSAAAGFDAAPITGSIGTGGEIDCHVLGGVTQGDRMNVAFTGSAGSPTLRIVDADANTVCQMDWSANGDCHLTGTAPWSMLVYGDNDSSTFSYSLAARRLREPQGCVPLGAPDVWSFTSPRVNGSIAGALQARCYSFTRGLGEADGAYWFRAVRVSGTLQPRWRVYAEDGTRQCSGNTTDLTRCDLLTSGEHIVVVDGETPAGQGTFFLAPRRTSSPSGCAPISSIAFGIPTMFGKLSAGGEVDCYRFTGATADRLRLTTTGTADTLVVLAEEGREVCRQWQQPCSLDATEPHTLLLFASGGTAVGSYTLTAECENVPCGQSETSVTDVTPRRVGASENTTLQLRGRDLNLVDDVRLVRGSTSLSGEIQPPAPDGRGVDVRFDLNGASAGAWDLIARFIDGSERTVSAAVTVETVRPADIRVELVGRDVFRAGVPSPVTIRLHNSGNVDGVGVPVALRGIPVGATIEPQFDLQRAQGSVDSPQLANTAFDPAKHAIAYGSELSVPLFVPRVPAGRSVELGFHVTAPTAGESYVLRAAAGRCLGDAAAPSLGILSMRIGEADTWPCYEIAAQQAIDFVPFGPCFNAGYEIGGVIGRGIINPLLGVRGEAVMSHYDVLDFSLAAAGCGLDATGVGAVARKTGATQPLDEISLASTGMQLVDNGCLGSTSSTSLPRTVVGAVDPNDKIGPVGAGEARFIRGDTPLGYRVLFENLPAATAPAQRVRITDQLDVAKFDPASVLFEEVSFGATVYRLVVPSPSIDHRIDLRPAQDLLVDVTAGVDASGLITWTLQALDPETLAPPDDPLAGFLPPNRTAPEGEGAAAFRVSLRSEAQASGTEIRNGASIVFDLNDPIETPVWSNRIDLLAPDPSVQVLGGPDRGKAEITWGGTDDAAGITYWEIRVSKDGAPFELWRVSDTAGSAIFPAETAGRYQFRAFARDGAGNSAHSPIAAMTLTPGVVDAPPPPSPGADTPARPGAPESPAAPSLGTSGGVAPTGSGTSGTPAARPGITGKLKKGARVKVRSDGRFSLPLRAACAGAGPACRAVVTVVPSRKIKALSRLGSGSAKLAVGKSWAFTGRMSGKAMKEIRKRRGLQAKVTLEVARGGQRTRKVVSVKFVAS